MALALNMKDAAVRPSITDRRRRAGVNGLLVIFVS
jgi:hypothetical protein